MQDTPDPAALDRRNQTIQALLDNQRRREGQPDPLPADPDEAAALALSAILDPAAAVLPADLFKELTRRNTQLLTAPASEIKATLSRQVVLLEALAVRQFQKASHPSNKPSVTETYIRAGLAAERVLIQTLGAMHQVIKDESMDDDVVFNDETPDHAHVP